MGMAGPEIEQRLLYRDGLILVLDKPAGLPVHAGPGGGDNLERHFRYLQFGLPHPPALAHRLDRDTSGCLILGRHRKALAKLGRLFAAGEIEKTYWAIVAGTLPAESGRIDLPLKKISTRKGGWRMIGAKADDSEAKPAITDYRRLGRAGDLSWLELRPLTGRTHQIRVHLAALGTPILGDRQYRSPSSAAPAGAEAKGQGEEDAGTGEASLYLHARSLKIPLYPKKPPLFVEAPPPPAFADLLRKMAPEAVAGSSSINPTAEGKSLRS